MSSYQNTLNNIPNKYKKSYNKNNNNYNNSQINLLNSNYNNNNNNNTNYINNNNNNNILLNSIQKLYHSICQLVPINKNLNENSLNYYYRLLSSSFFISQTDESKILNMIFDRAQEITNNDIEKITRLQTLYSLLTKKKFPTKRWSILYLLNGLSKTKNINVNFTGQNNLLNTMLKLNNPIDDKNMNLDIKYLNNNNNDNNDNNLNENNKKKHFSSPIIVNMSKTNNVITEKDIINDLMFVFQGIDGHYIKYNSEFDRYVLNELIPWNENIIEIVGVLCELGWLYKKVSNFLNYFNNNNEINFQFLQSFCYSIQNELNEYYKLISFFKKKNGESDLNNENNNINNINNSNSNIINNKNIISKNNDLTLKNLFLWTIEPIERMKWLSIACDSVFNLKGSSIISQIYSYVNYSGADIYLNKVLEEVLKPLIIFIKNWIMYGLLQDPYKEFFVDIIDKINDDDIWNLKYQIVYKNIPNFLNRELVIKIFEIGKCINFIIHYCKEVEFNLGHLLKDIKSEIENAENKINELNNNNNNIDNMNIDNEKKFNVINNNNNINIIDINSYKCCYNFIVSLFNNQDIIPNNNNLNNINNSSNESEKHFLNDLIINIDLIHELINKTLLKILFVKFNFKENLDSINRYLLLGQGDMMQSLMESLFDELKKPANHIYMHNLQANLETAIRASNAQFNDQECLKKLNIKLLDANAGDTGWDIFILEYNVEVPLTCIFTKNLLKEYQKLFFFFWKLKRLEYSQNHQIWRKFMTYSHSLKNYFDFSMRKVIQRSMLFNQQVIHFVSNLYNFFALEVLETQYKKMIENLSNLKTLDELILCHKNFVENIIKQSLLNQENSSLYKKIISIFDLIIRFRTALDVLTTSFLEIHYENNNNFDNNNNDFENSLNKNFSNEAAKQISNLFEEFKNNIIELIKNIEYFGKDNLKYLAMKLDFNNYYSMLEKEIENKKQNEMIEKMNLEHERINNEINNNDDDNDEDNNNEEDEDEEFHEEPSGIDDNRFNNTMSNRNNNSNINNNNNINYDENDEEEINTNLHRNNNNNNLNDSDNIHFNNNNNYNNNNNNYNDKSDDDFN